MCPVQGCCFQYPEQPVYHQHAGMVDKHPAVKRFLPLHMGAGSVDGVFEVVEKLPYLTPVLVFNVYVPGGVVSCCA